MAIVKSPLHSTRASGKIGERLVFIHRGGRQTARFQRAQPNHPTSSQDVYRAAYSEAVGVWNGLTPEQKAVYIDEAVGLHMSGYNLFVKTYLAMPPGGGALYGDRLYGDFYYGES